MGNPVGRNDPCPCGSGKKYKHCHFSSDQEGLKTLLPQDPIRIRSHSGRDYPSPHPWHPPFEYGQGEKLRGFEPEITLITDTLKNYDPKVIKSFRTITWNCRSKLFHFFVSLAHVSFHYELVASFSSQSAITFQLGRKKRDYQPSPFSYEVIVADPDVNDLFEITAENSAQVKDVLDESETTSLKQLVFFDSVRVERKQIIARKAKSDLGTLETWPEAFHSLITFIRYIAHFQYRLMPKQELALCPYCREPFAKRERLVTCSVCHTVEHLDCWNELGYCAVFGCESKEKILHSAL